MDLFFNLYIAVYIGMFFSYFIDISGRNIGGRKRKKKIKMTKILEKIVKIRRVHPVYTGSKIGQNFVKKRMFSRCKQGVCTECQKGSKLDPFFVKYMCVCRQNFDPPFDP